MKDFIVLITTIFIFLIWFIPSREAHYFGNNDPIGMLYLPIFLITVYWIYVIQDYITIKNK